MKYPFFSARFFKYGLVATTAFVSLSATAGGIGLLLTNGLGMTVASLNGTFSSFMIPGLILFFVVGGSNLAAAILVARNWKYALESAMIAGFGLQIWIYVELCILGSVHWLHSFYFALGTLILIFTCMVYGRKHCNG